MEQVLICLEKKEGLKPNILTLKQKELLALGKALLGGYKNTIARQVEKTLDADVSREEILQLVAFIIGDVRLFRSIVELLRVLSYEESKRAQWISVVDDVREG